jgi:endonuclease/exonuclease/phosphatase family metal-dependent hydrolase
MHRLLLCCLAVLAVLPATALGASKPEVTVMTRNLYLGADIIKAASAQTLPDFRKRAGELWDTVVATDFPTRAKAIAKEIAARHVDLVGLQEAPRWVVDGRTRYDFLKILVRALRKEGERYRVARAQGEFEITAPTDRGFEVHLKMRDAILARRGVKVRRTMSGNFHELLTVPLVIGDVKVKRGWEAVDFAVDGRRARFVNFHAEAYSGDIAADQTRELLRRAASSRKRPTILVGDFNSDPRNKASAGGYEAALGAGFVETGHRQLTCCQTEDLRNRRSQLDQWIDHILVRPKMKVVRQGVVGNRARDRIHGLWPSDHAGVFATLRLP